MRIALRRLRDGLPVIEQDVRLFVKVAYVRAMEKKLTILVHIGPEVWIVSRPEWFLVMQIVYANLNVNNVYYP